MLSALQRVLRESYDNDTKVVHSTLVLEVNTETVNYLRNSSWWCEVEYTVLDDSTVHMVQGEPVTLNFLGYRFETSHSIDTENSKKGEYIF